jgi:hypothetical protein
MNARSLCSLLFGLTLVGCASSPPSPTVPRASDQQAIDALAPALRACFRSGKQRVPLLVTLNAQGEVTQITAPESPSGAQRVYPSPTHLEGARKSLLTHHDARSSYREAKCISDKVARLQFASETTPRTLQFHIE